MGGVTSCLGPSASGLTSSLRRGDERAALRKLEANPCLLSTPTNRLSLLATTPLHDACKRKRVEAVQEVLLFLSSSPLEVVREALRPYCRRADLSLPASVPEGVWMAVNMTNTRGQTPLMYACHMGSPELIRLLLAHGADPWIRDRPSARTALHYAALGADTAASIKVLLKEMPPGAVSRRNVRYVDCGSDCGLTALHYCVYLGDLAATRELLRHGPNLNAATSTDVLVTCEPASTPLHFAAVRGNLEAAREMLQCYARRIVSDPESLIDPRTLANGKQQLPWQVAITHHPDNQLLAALLHPSHSIQDALANVPGNVPNADGPVDPRVGPLSLAAIAGAALKAKLEAEVRKVECGQLAVATATMRGISASVGVAGSAGPGADPQQLRNPKIADAPCQVAAAQAPWAAPPTDRPSTSVVGTTGQECPVAGKGTSYASTSDPYNRFSDASCYSGGDMPACLEEDGDQDGVCGVCFAAPQAVAPAGCGHGVCVDCAEKLCRGIRAKPLRCPFCRKRVTGFVIFDGASVQQADEKQQQDEPEVRATKEQEPCQDGQARLSGSAQRLEAEGAPFGQHQQASTGQQRQ